MSLIKAAGRCADVILVVMLVCSVHEDTGAQGQPEGGKVPGRYLEYSRYTDPGEYAYLYDAIKPIDPGDLTGSLEGLCDLIKRQLIHPFEASKFAGQIPEGREYEDMEYPTVGKMLAELLERSESGLTLDRTPSGRLVVACVHHCMLFTSILRHNGIPVRMRAGYATYIGSREGLRVTHAVCEVWNGKNGKWILVDPDRSRVDFPRSEFEFAWQTWDLLRGGCLEHEYFVRRYGTVDRATLHLLVHDLSYLTGGEELYYNEPPVVELISKGIEDLPGESLRLIDRLVELLGEPDANIGELVRIQEETPGLQYETE